VHELAGFSENVSGDCRMKSSHSVSMGNATDEVPDGEFLSTADCQFRICRWRRECAQFVRGSSDQVDRRACGTQSSHPVRVGL